MCSGCPVIGLGMMIVRTTCGSVVFGVGHRLAASGFPASGKLPIRDIVGFQDVGRQQKMTSPMKFCLFRRNHWKKGRRASRFRKINFGCPETGDIREIGMFGVPDFGPDVTKIGCGFLTITWPLAQVVGTSQDTGIMAGISGAHYTRLVISPIIALVCATVRA